MAQILFFGRLSDIAKSQNMTLPETVRDTEALIDFLSADGLPLRTAMQAPGASIVVNQEIVASPHPIADADEIAFLSPVSGG